VSGSFPDDVAFTDSALKPTDATHIRVRPRRLAAAGGQLRRARSGTSAHVWARDVAARPPCLTRPAPCGSRARLQVTVLPNAV